MRSPVENFPRVFSIPFQSLCPFFVDPAAKLAIYTTSIVVVISDSKSFYILQTCDKKSKLELDICRPSLPRTPNSTSICYRKGFLSSTSCGLLSRKFGVHHHPLYWVSDTLGGVIAPLSLNHYALRWRVVSPLTSVLPLIKQ